MNSSEKYIELKNYMHNTLGITKADIEQWIKEAIQGTLDTHVKRMLTKSDFISEACDTAINRAMKSSGYGDPSLKDLIARSILNDLSKHIEVKVEVKKP